MRSISTNFPASRPPVSAIMIAGRKMTGPKAGPLYRERRKNDRKPRGRSEDLPRTLTSGFTAGRPFSRRRRTRAGCRLTGPKHGRIPAGTSSGRKRAPMFLPDMSCPAVPSGIIKEAEKRQDAAARQRTIRQWGRRRRRSWLIIRRAAKKGEIGE